MNPATFSVRITMCTATAASSTVRMGSTLPVGANQVFRRGRWRGSAGWDAALDAVQGLPTLTLRVGGLIAAKFDQRLLRETLLRSLRPEGQEPV